MTFDHPELSRSNGQDPFLFVRHKDCKNYNAMVDFKLFTLGKEFYFFNYFYTQQEWKALVFHQVIEEWHGR
jgi:hypothetical protein